MKRKANQFAAGDFEKNIRQKKHEKLNLDMQIDVLRKERDAIEADSQARVVLAYKKKDLENYRKKHRRMQVFINLYAVSFTNYSTPF